MKTQGEGARACACLSPGLMLLSWRGLQAPVALPGSLAREAQGEQQVPGSVCAGRRLLNAGLCVRLRGCANASSRARSSTVGVEKKRSLGELSVTKCFEVRVSPSVAWATRGLRVSSPRWRRSAGWEGAGAGGGWGRCWGEEGWGRRRGRGVKGECKRSRLGVPAGARHQARRSSRWAGGLRDGAHPRHPGC